MPVFLFIYLLIPPPPPLKKTLMAVSAAVWIKIFEMEKKKPTSTIQYFFFCADWDSFSQCESEGSLTGSEIRWIHFESELWINL